MSEHADIESVATPWRQVVLVCKKCSKKLDGGFGPDGDQTLGRALKGAARQAGLRQQVRVIETKCLGLCPKNAVTVLPGGQPGALLVVRRGAEPAALLSRLAGPPGTAAGGDATG